MPTPRSGCSQSCGSDSDSVEGAIVVGGENERDSATYGKKALVYLFSGRRHSMGLIIILVIISLFKALIVLPPALHRANGNVYQVLTFQRGANEGKEEEDQLIAIFGRTEAKRNLLLLWSWNLRLNSLSFLRSLVRSEWAGNSIIKGDNRLFEALPNRRLLLNTRALGTSTPN